MRALTKYICLLFLASALAACGETANEDGALRTESDVELTTPVADLPKGAQALSFLGEPLYPPDIPQEARARMQEEMSEALRNLEANPTSPDAIIWAGRRAAYLGQYRRAIEFFTLGIQGNPTDPRFYRHRGHRFITVRELDRAVRDFSRAAELIQGTEDQVEPDGQPNALGVPTSTLHFNIWYHYGLAHYLKGEFDQAVEEYRRCMEVSEHPDSKIATAHWLYMSLRRLGMDEEARSLVQGLDLEALAPEVIESGSYLELLYLYRGDRDVSDQVDQSTLEGATLSYGLGNWYLYNGAEDRAREIFTGIIEARNQWPAFGYLAAEADLARMAEG